MLNKPFTVTLKNHGIRKEQIPSKIEGFTDAIESIFGEAAKLVELKIIEKLQRKVMDSLINQRHRTCFLLITWQLCTDI